MHCVPVRNGKASTAINEDITQEERNQQRDPVTAVPRFRSRLLLTPLPRYPLKMPSQVSPFIQSHGANLFSNRSTFRDSSFPLSRSVKKGSMPISYHAEMQQHRLCASTLHGTSFRIATSISERKREKRVGSHSGQRKREMTPDHFLFLPQRGRPHLALRLLIRCSPLVTFARPTLPTAGRWQRQTVPKHATWHGLARIVSDFSTRVAKWQSGKVAVKTAGAG